MCTVLHQYCAIYLWSNTALYVRTWHFLTQDDIPMTAPSHAVDNRTSAATFRVIGIHRHPSAMLAATIDKHASIGCERFQR
jgi:hypothetical protein